VTAAPPVEHLAEDWESMAVVDVSESLVRRAGGLAERRGLRGYDTIQLAAALEVHPQGDFAFACFDTHLARTARREGVRVAALQEEG
jgi:predicted nucleic acid-binding protein